MTILKSISWPRIAAESIAIVVSILLAFVINAWWQLRGDREQAATLVNDLIVDFEASQSELQRALSEHRRDQQAAKALLASVQDAEPGSQITIPVKQAIAAVMGPTYSPTTATIDLAFATGRIELIENQELRNRLAFWRFKVADDAEEELQIHEIGSKQLLPILSEQIRFGRFLNEDLITDWRADPSGQTRFDEQVQLQVSSEFEGLLGNRVFLGNFVVQELGELVEIQEEILDLLRHSSNAE